MAHLYRDVTESAPCFMFSFRQMRAGPHENFHYVIGDPRAKEAAVVDPSFALDEVFHAAEHDGLAARTALFTHGHWDHIGGVPAIADHGVREVVAHRALEGAPKLDEARDAGMDVRLVDDGDVLHLGEVPVRVLHTPGHQPESTCYLVGDAHGPQALFGGDCLFIDSCGRTDFPGGDTDAMFASMARLRALLEDPDVGEVHVMPGHDYADRAHEPLSLQVNRNPALATTDRADFEALPFLRG